MQKTIYIYLCLLSLALFTSIAAMEFLSAILFLSCIIYLVKAKPKMFFDKSYLVIFTLFILSHIFSIAFSEYIEWSDFFKYFRKIRWIVYIPLFAHFILAQEEKIKSIYKVYLFFAFLVSSFSIYQVFTGVDLIKGSIQSGSPFEYGPLSFWRAQGFFTNTMTYSHVMGMFIAALSPFVIRLRNYYYVIPFLVGALSFLFGFTRGAWLAMLITLFVGYFVFYSKNRLRLLGITVVSLVILLMLPVVQDRAASIFDPTDFSFMSRINLWHANVEMFLDNPVFGIGPNQNMDLTQTYFQKMGIHQDFVGHAHNSYIQYLSTGGGFGILTYLLFIFYFMYTNIRLVLYYRNRNEKVYLFVFGLLLGQSFFHIAGMTEAVNIDAEILHQLTWFTAFILVFRHKQLEETRVSSS